MRRLIPALVAALFLALVPLAARADGEAGLVIQVGDEVRTYCVPFAGESISGEQLLAASGLPVEQFGGGSGRVVCAIGGVGCFDPGSFDACFCQCRGSDCTYWAFFTRAYGKGWVYSSVGISLARARDGDVHGWKWGRGGPSSAPAPADVTFEQICGHPPRGGQAPTATPPPLATFTPAGPPPAGGSTPAPTATFTPASAAATATTAAPGSPSPAPPTAVITLAPVLTPASTPSLLDGGGPSPRDGADEGGAPWAFGAVAGGLVLAIAAAAAWRVRRGR